MTTYRLTLIVCAVCLSSTGWAVELTKFQYAKPDPAVVSIFLIGGKDSAKKGCCNAVSVTIKNMGTRSTETIQGRVKIWKHNAVPVTTNWEKRVQFASLRPGESRTVTVNELQFRTLGDNYRLFGNLDRTEQELSRDNNSEGQDFIKVREECYRRKSR